MKKEFHAQTDTTGFKPEWLRVSAAVAYSGISRSLLYELMDSGDVESHLLRKRGALRGIRLISVDSLDSFIRSLPTGEKGGSDES